ncbi:hypothetical protein AI2850V1_1692 [Klebsiella pneumoniae]|nr:hypothetical protein AI2850V1_1692 [Klebsiella pneumoniae]CAH5169238.1 hypothetical protein AI2850V1_1692 [Klebsiella pneumoniae]SYM49486.1 Uncharacterised protein [Klebsiella pneumoniae]SYM79941.1 Uncharacterised protein [Klebsiella pneumoniae]
MMKDSLCSDVGMAMNKGAMDKWLPDIGKNNVWAMFYILPTFR